MLTQKRFAAALLVVAAALALLLLADAWLVPRPVGLRLEVETPCLPEASATGVVSAINASVLPSAARKSGCAQARWSGFWALPDKGAIRLKIVTDGALRLGIDGRPLLEIIATGMRARRKVVMPLTAGLHALALDWMPDAGARPGLLRVLWARRPGQWQVVEEATLFPERPTALALLAARARPFVQQLALAVWLVTAIVWGVGLRSRWRPLVVTARRAFAFLRTGWRSRALAGAVLALILVYGAGLRFEALLGGYWPEAPPRWAERVVSWVHPLRPRAWHWPHVEHPYGGGDAAAYLRYARQMHNPYEPRVREPLFVMATKAGLWVTGWRDVGVSVASCAFSVLAIAVTYLLGAYAFSRWVGLGAALALAIEHQAIAQSVTGFRDEAFAVFVVLTAWAALRLYRRGTFGDALLLGFAGGAAWLTRITTPTLLLPMYLALASFPRSRPWRQRLERVAVAGLIACALMAPFMVNCAVRYGDPFYSINEHVVFYRVGSNLSYNHGMTVLDYLRSSFRPAQMADTVFIGYTEYPFGRKWDYGDWARPLGPILAGMSIAGIALWLFSASGRLLLLAHLATMFAFAFTYEAREGGPWRLTFHAYPFYLIAASLAAVWSARLLVSAGARQRLRAWLSLRRGFGLAAAAGGLVASSWLLWHGLSYLRFAETLAAARDPGRLVGFQAGSRDAFFFAENWHMAAEAPGWPEHYWRGSRGRAATLRLPLTAGRGYVVTLGLDPVLPEQSSPGVLQVDFNGRRLAAIGLQWHPEKTGRYTVPVPAPFVIEGANRLTLSVDPAALAGTTDAARKHAPDGSGAAFALYYVMIRPSAASALTSPEPSPRVSSGPTPLPPSPRDARPER